MKSLVECVTENITGAEKNDPDLQNGLVEVPKKYKSPRGTLQFVLMVLRTFSVPELFMGAYRAVVNNKSKPCRFCIKGAVGQALNKNETYYEEQGLDENALDFCEAVGFNVRYKKERNGGYEGYSSAVRKNTYQKVVECLETILADGSWKEHLREYERKGFIPSDWAVPCYPK